MIAFVFAAVTFVSTLSGGLFAIRFKNQIHYIIAFTAGVLIAVTFFDIVPEIFNTASASETPIIRPLIALIVGFLVIHILEKVAVLHHSHEEEYADHKHPMVGLISALGLSFHSFLDGVGIGLGFQVNFEIG